MQIRVIHLRNQKLIRRFDRYVARCQRSHGGGCRKNGKYLPKLHTVDVAERLMSRALDIVEREERLVSA